MYGVISRKAFEEDVSRGEALPPSINCYARLDNREELARLLEILPLELSNYSDQQLIELAYESWGEECPRYLLGDFSFVIADPVNAKVFCARDHLGIAPLYYYFGPDYFVFGTSVKQLAESSEFDATLDSDSICCYLRDGELYHPTNTFFKEIKKLSPAHSLLLTSWQTSNREYWSIADVQTRPCVPYEQRVRELRNILKVAVETRTINSGALGIHVSGGLDSSAIAALMHDTQDIDLSNAYAYTWLPASGVHHSARDDEYLAAQLTSDRIKLPLQYSNLSADRLVKILETHNISHGDTNDCWAEWDIREQAKAAGVTTIISGWGGDNFVSHPGLQHYTQLLLRGKIHTVVSELWSAVRASRRPLRRFIVVFWQLVAQPLVFRLISRSRPHAQYLDAANTKTKDRAKTLVSKIDSRVPLTVRDDQLNSAGYLHLLNRIESWWAGSHHRGIRYSYPLLDKRVVEYALGISSDSFCSEGVTRRIFREALRDILPQAMGSHSAKNEPRRTAMEISLCIQAITRWKQDRPVPTQNAFIDSNKLYELIGELEAASEPYTAQTTHLVSAVIRAILVLNLDQR